jgi:hypothetical protein
MIDRGVAARPIALPPMSAEPTHSGIAKDPLQPPRRPLPEAASPSTGRSAFEAASLAPQPAGVSASAGARARAMTITEAVLTAGTETAGAPSQSLRPGSAPDAVPFQPAPPRRAAPRLDDSDAALEDAAWRHGVDGA